jgi:hypothetical protein
VRCSPSNTEETQSTCWVTPPPLHSTRLRCCAFAITTQSCDPAPLLLQCTTGHVTQGSGRVSFLHIVIAPASTPHCSSPACVQDQCVPHDLPVQVLRECPYRKVVLPLAPHLLHRTCSRPALHLVLGQRAWGALNVPRWPPMCTDSTLPVLCPELPMPLKPPLHLLHLLLLLNTPQVPHMRRGSSIINSTSVTAYNGSPSLLEYRWAGWGACWRAL